MSMEAIVPSPIAILYPFQALGRMALMSVCLASFPSAWDAMDSLMVAMETAVSNRPNPLQYIIASLLSESKPGLPAEQKRCKIEMTDRPTDQRAHRGEVQCIRRDKNTE